MQQLLYYVRSRSNPLQSVDPVSTGSASSGALCLYFKVICACTLCGSFGEEQACPPPSLCGDPASNSSVSLVSDKSLEQAGDVDWMWSKVAKLASPAPRKPAARLDTPLPAEQLFHALRRVLDPDDAASSSARAAEVERLLVALLQVLKVEARSETPPLGEALELLLENNSLGSLVDLILDSRDAVLRAVLLRWYAEAIDQLDGAWLSHSAVNKPLCACCPTFTPVLVSKPDARLTRLHAGQSSSEHACRSASTPSTSWTL